MATTDPPAGQDAPTGVWLAIPDGYRALPLGNIPQIVRITAQLINELGTPAQREASEAVLGLLAASLETLAARHAVYCGVGWHRSAGDGQLITSSLVVTLLEFAAQRNPRLVLKDLLQAKKDAEESGQPDLVELPNGSALFFERTRTLPAPPMPRQHVLAAGAESPVWQLQAFVPSPEGDKLATIEVSTPFADHGPQYRGMVVTMAAGVAFEPPAQTDAVAAALG